MAVRCQCTRRIPLYPGSSAQNDFTQAGRDYQYFLHLGRNRRFLRGLLFGIQSGTHRSDKSAGKRGWPFWNSGKLHALAEETPLGRIGTPEDISAAALFLASSKASFITGQVLGANGGLVI